MKNQAGHVKGQASDKNGFRQFVVNCLGGNDQRKYFSISPFGIDSNPPVNTRALTADSSNKDVQFNLGVLNKIKIEDLQPGEPAIFSTSEDGETIVSQIVLRNTGDIEINKDISGNATVLIKADGTIDLNGNADNIVGFTELKAGFDTLTSNLNNLITSYNAHTHITTATVGATPTPGIIAPTTNAGTPSTASIDASKKDNLLTE